MAVQDGKDSDTDGNVADSPEMRDLQRIVFD